MIYLTPKPAEAMNPKTKNPEMLFLVLVSCWNGIPIYLKTMKKRMLEFKLNQRLFNILDKEKLYFDLPNIINKMKNL